MIWVFAWIAFACAAYTVGSRKGRPGLGLALGVFLSAAGLLVIACLPPAKPKPLTPEQRALADYRAEHVPLSEEYRARKNQP